ncbi:TIGR01458 family HAD-type hydrolase [Candidatus Marinarcus aquaticus]|uniref:Haloacid dehalogenase-like hydrolase domain-containing protein 2 n=1 Tax=Candidatus Marinarcus aquaticus TaxID=2044504 RepID=A0A4Q0XY52_9BACT|nr:TIGR01458 family HAD-type hydrolase [Candidatus Marinarcus aquaticus]RXJ60891.1 TIGR01458 family HAD-type hydrolase [Candidatus Marinarcus aquaticus]
MFSKNIKAVLCDIGGVLYVGDAPIDGAVEAVAKIKKHYPIRFITNTTQKTGAQVIQKLQEFGFDICEDEVITALDMTKMFLQKHQSNAQFLLTDNVIHFFDSLKKYPTNYVVVGDAQDNFSYKNLNHAFRRLQQGAQLVAIANNRYFKDSDNELSLDAGCFVSALEYASGQKAQLIGKPSLEFYQLAAASLNAQPNECVMIGDDIESDIEGAQKAGIYSVLVKTGKFRETDLEKGITPNQTFESIHDLIL